ncbi:MAG: urease accessory protein UreD [Acidiferrobacterales bacterium]
MDTSSMAPANEASTGWQAQLKLFLQKQQGRTVLARRSHFGPLAVQRPFYPETDGTCHVYILHPPGGIVGGDELRIETHIDQDARCLVTTPGATKLYRSGGDVAVITNILTIAGKGSLEWMPQETIVFDGSHSVTTTDVHLQPDSEFCGWDIVCFGRPAAGEVFHNGSYRQSFRIWRDHRPIAIEANALDGGSQLLTANWGLSGYSVSGTFLFVTRDTRALPALRERIENRYPDCRFSITQMREVIVARYLGDSAEQAKALFADVWSLFRKEIYRRFAVRPRIWDT